MIAWLKPNLPDWFPALELALREPNGLLCVGGDLAPARLLAGYRHGVFPWFGLGEPILWWSPDPRCVFPLAAQHAPARLLRYARQQAIELRWNQDFSDVMQACAAPRTTDAGTWITPEMLRAYHRLHVLGYAYCLCALRAGKVIGGVYGVALGGAFFAESMFSRASNGSKLALYSLLGLLKHSGFSFMDAQVASPHVLSLGAQQWPRAQFKRELDAASATPISFQVPQSRQAWDWIKLLDQTPTHAA